MIKLSKERPDDEVILVFDVRPKNICLELSRPVKVYLGRITPSHDYGYWTWESAWGGNTGREPALEIAQYYIEKCAKGMYK